MQFSNSLTKQYFVILTAAVILYIISCAPSLVWQDSGMIQYRVLHNDIKGGMGLALSHPLYYIISICAKSIPVGSVIYRINLVAALAGAFAVANIYLLMRLWIADFWPAIVSTMTLALSHTFWWHASVVETYDMYLAFFLAELIFCLMYLRTNKPVHLYLLGLFNGLAISVHMLAVIPLACYAVYVVYLLVNRKIKMPVVWVCISFWVIGALPYEYLIVGELIRTGDLVATIKSALFGNSWQSDVLNTTLSWKIIKENIFFLCMNFPTPNILLLIPGLYLLFKLEKQRAFAGIIIALFLLFLIFACRYTVSDRYTFFLPFYAVVSLLIGLGAYSFRRNYIISAVALCLAVLPAMVYILLPAMAERCYPVFKSARHLPYRSEYKWFLQPWKTGYYGADRFAHQALESVPEDSLMFADGTSLYPLAIKKQLDFTDKKINIMSSHGSYDNISRYSESQLFALIDSHPSYVVSNGRGYCPQYILSNYKLVEDGVLFRITAE